MTAQSIREAEAEMEGIRKDNDTMEKEWRINKLFYITSVAYEKDMQVT